MFPPFHEELRRFLENYKAERISCGCDNASFEPDSTSKLESDAVDNYEELKADFLSLWNVVAASYINRDKKTRPGNDYLTLCGGLPPGVYHSLAGLRDSNMAENHTCKWKHLQGTAEKSDCQKKGGRRSSLAGTSDCDDRIIGTRFRPKKLDSSDFPISMPKGLCENSSESRNLGGNSSPGLARDCDKRDTSSDDVLEDRCVLGKREKVTPDMENVIKKLRIWGDSRRPADLSRSQYSLVSCAELTPDAVQLWLGLPDEVKYDPALDSFRKLYEREHGKVAQISAATRKNGRQQRLPLVSSAPHLNNNTHFTIDDVIPEGERHDVTADSKINGVLPTEPKHETPLKKAANFTKIFLLVSAWIFFTVVFMLYNEKENVVMNTSILPGALKRYNFNATDESISIRLTLIGPFLSEQTEFKLNKTEAENALKLTIWLEENENKLKEGPWSVVLLDKDSIDFSTGETRTLLLQAKHSNSDLISLAINTTSDVAVPVRLAIKDDPLPTNTGVIYASLLLCALYLLIVFEIMNRTMAAVIVSTSSLAVLAIAGERPSVQELVSWLDVETLLLLFSMMILVAIMAETGIFDFLAVYTFEVTKGKLWPLITLLCVITAVLSTFLDNVTTVLLMTPVTIRLCEVMDLNPIPILLSMVLFSNIGGTATPVGDPPNVIIASNKAVIQAGINFTNFTLHMTAGILLVCVQTYFQLRFIYRDTNKLRLNVPREIQDARHQISIWRRAIDSLPHLSKDEHVVRERLERKCSKLSLQLQALMKDSKKRACPKDTFQSTLAELKGKYKIKNVPLLVKASVSIVFVVVVFFLHSLPELSRVSLGWTALLGALLLLILADREDLEPILHRVEWSTLLFFAALFVLMEALAKLGLIDFIGHLTEQLIVSVPSKARLAVALLLMLWVSGLASAFIDNIPLTTMMVRVVTSLGANPALPELPLPPLVWALAFAACLGGNGTLIGASANVVCAGVAEQHGYKFTFMEFFKVGFPVMIGHLVVASAYLLLCHCVFTWH